MERAILGLLVCASACASPPDPTLVIFDESAGEIFSIGDPGFMGYSRAAQALLDAGYRVEANTQPLATRLEAVESPDGTVLVVALPTADIGQDASYALAEFSRRGGRLFVLAEHDDAYGSSAIINTLLGETPIRVGDGRIGGRELVGAYRAQVASGLSSTFGLDSIRVYLAGRLSAPAEDVVRLAETLDGEPLALGAPWGRGRVAVVADTEFLWNGSPDMGIRVAQNEAFLLRVVEWLVSARGGSAGEPSNASREVGEGAIVAWVGGRNRFGDGRDGYSNLLEELERRGFDVAVTGDSSSLTRASAVILAEPLAELPRAILEVPRAVALLHWVSAPPSLFPATLATRGLASAAAHPAGTLLALADLAVLPGVVKAAGQDNDGRTDTCVADRSAALTLGDSGPHDVLLWTAGRATRNVLPFVTAGGRYLDGFIDATSAEGWPLVVSTPRLLAVASGSLVANAQYGQPCFNRLLDALEEWLRTAAP